jgi:hypothetical protein
MCRRRAPGALEDLRRLVGNVAVAPAVLRGRALHERRQFVGRLPLVHLRQLIEEAIDRRADVPRIRVQARALLTPALRIGVTARQVAQAAFYQARLDRRPRVAGSLAGI